MAARRGTYPGGHRRPKRHFIILTRDAHLFWSFSDGIRHRYQARISSIPSSIFLCFPGTVSCNKPRQSSFKSLSTRHSWFSHLSRRYIFL